MLVPLHRHRQDRLFCSSQHAVPGPPERRHSSREPYYQRATAFVQESSSGIGRPVVPSDHPLGVGHSDQRRLRSSPPTKRIPFHLHTNPVYSDYNTPHTLTINS